MENGKAKLISIWPLENHSKFAQINFDRLENQLHFRLTIRENSHCPPQDLSSS